MNSKTQQEPRMTVEIIHGDCIEAMRNMPDNSVDSIVTDPPYGLGFMGKKWDALPPGEDWAGECLRVLKPGGHLLAFGGSRTWHRLAVAVEDAGFEIRDSIAWMYGSGFPKSLDVSKAIDKKANEGPLFEAIRAHVRQWRDANGMTNSDLNKSVGSATNGCGMARHWTSEAGGQHSIPSKEQWRNLKAALNWPACELDQVYDAVKDGAERPVIGAYPTGLKTGTSGVGGGGAGGNITAAATPAAQEWQGWGTALKPAFEPVVVARKPLVGTVAANVVEFGTGAVNIDATRNGERWPSNVILDESQAGLLAESKYFYVAKAPKRERPVVDGVAHPTVKPLALMRWLVKLVTPPGGTVLEPFAGSGATVEACMLEGFNVIAIEQEAEYLPLIQARIDRAA